LIFQSFAVLGGRHKSLAGELPRGVEPGIDIALFLASPDNRATRGAVIPVYGGS